MTNKQKAQCIKRTKELQTEAKKLGFPGIDKAFMNLIKKLEEEFAKP